MANIERLANQSTSGVTATMTRMRTLATGFTILTALVGVATFATGWWVFHGSVGWIIVGALVCGVPIVCAAIARRFVGSATSKAGNLVAEITQVIRDSRHTAGPLIDHDSGRPITQSAKSFRELRTSIVDRRAELPGLFAAARAIASVPGLLAIALLMTIFGGLLGTILLIVGLLR